MKDNPTFEKLEKFLRENLEYYPDHFVYPTEDGISLTDLELMYDEIIGILSKYDYHQRVSVLLDNWEKLKQ